jgi:integrase
MKRDEVKPATVNRGKACLSVMLTKAVAWGYLERNPLEGMENLKETKKRDVDLSPEQAAQLIEALPSTEVKHIVAFGIYSGLRLEAILDLRIEDITYLDSGSDPTVLA